MSDEAQYIPEFIIATKPDKKKNSTLYLIKWQGYGFTIKDTTWEQVCVLYLTLICLI